MAHFDTRRCCCWWWFLMLVYFLWLPHSLLAKRNSNATAEKCRVYCLQCNDTSNQSPRVLLGDVLEVSLQVTPQGELPYSQIILHESSPSTYFLINQENVTMRINEKQDALLTLPVPRPAFSWVTFVVARPTKDTLLFYSPEDRINALTADVVLGPKASVSSHNRIYVAFNCLSGCLIRNASSALIEDGSTRTGEKATLHPPFTLYLQPAPPRPLQPSNHTVTPTLTLTHTESGENVTVNATNWRTDRWYRMKVLKEPKGNSRVEIIEQLGQHEDMGEVTVRVEDGEYRITAFEGFTSWTLHCPPQGLDAPPASQKPQDRPSTRKQTTTSTQSPGHTNGNEGEEGTGEGNSEKPRPRPSRGGAGAGEVVAWVLAGLALFLVMILALALCTKMRSPTHAQNFQDFPASVGVVSFKDMGTREPEEMSEPETPTLTIPNYNGSPTENFYSPRSCKVVEG